MTYTVQSVYRVSDPSRPPGATVYLQSADHAPDACVCLIVFDTRLFALAEGQTVTITVGDA